MLGFSMAAYIVPNDMISRYNVGRLGQLVRDDGTTATATQLQTDTVLAAAMSDAEGQFQAAVYKGQRYAKVDLDALLTAYQAGPTNAQYSSGSFMVRVIADLAYGNLIGRKGYDAATQAAMAPRSVWVEGILEQLAQGERVFNLTAQLNAGLPVNVDLDTERTLVSQGFSRYFGNLVVDPNNTLVH